MTEERVTIKVTNKAGKVAMCILDKSDHERIVKLSPNLVLGKNGYIYMDYNLDGKKQKIAVHRFVMNARKGQMVDHRNRNKHDNSQSNLRFVSTSQNNQNRDKKEGGSSQYYGVSKSGNRWDARCQQARKSFSSELHAAFWYDVTAKELLGNGARINGIEKPEDYVEPGPQELNIEEVDSEQNDDLVILSDTEIASMIPNDHRNTDGIAVLPCRDSFVLINDEWYLRLRDQTIRLSKKGFPRVRIDGTRQLLHRLVFGAQPGELLKFIDNNYFNCQLNNLRIITSSEIVHNQTKREGLSSVYMNVTKNNRRFYASVTRDGIRYSAGAYDENEEVVAAWAANQLAIELYGDNVTLNEVDLPGYVFVNYRAVREGDTSGPTPRQKPLKRKLKHEGAFSKFAGVSKTGNSYAVRFMKDGETYRASQYLTELKAAFAADQLAIQLFGEDCPERNFVTLPGYVFKNNRVISDKPPVTIGGVKSETASSPYFGVSKNRNCFMVRFKNDGTRYGGGLYRCELTAALASNYLAIEVYGPDYKKRNIVEELPGYVWQNHRLINEAVAEPSLKRQKTD